MSFRGLEPKGKCIKKNAPDLLGYLESELADRGMDNVMVSSTGCLKLCEKGPVVLVYPEGYWYQGVEGEDAIDAILDGLENGGPAKEYLVDWTGATERHSARLRSAALIPSPLRESRGDPVGRPRVG